MYRLHESAFRHQLFRLLGRHHNDLQVLGGVQMLAADLFAVPDQVTVGEVADTGRIRRDLTEKYGLASSGRKLQKDLSRSMAVLAHENEVPVNGDGDHDNKIRHIIYIKRRDLRAIRQCAVIGVKIDPAVLYDRPGSVADPRFNRHNLFLLNQDKYNLKSSLRKRTDQFNELPNRQNAQADKR